MNDEARKVGAGGVRGVSREQTNSRSAGVAVCRGNSQRRKRQRKQRSLDGVPCFPSIPDGGPLGRKRLCGPSIEGRVHRRDNQRPVDKTCRRGSGCRQRQPPGACSGAVIEHRQPGERDREHFNCAAYGPEGHVQVLLYLEPLRPVQPQFPCDLEHVREPKPQRECDEEQTEKLSNPSLHCRHAAANGKHGATRKDRCATGSPCEAYEADCAPRYTCARERSRRTTDLRGFDGEVDEHCGGGFASSVTSHRHQRRVTGPIIEKAVHP